jgi:hypothetical protein
VIGEVVMSSDDERFWDAAATLLERNDVTRSTMMGLPCLRVNGKFVAAFDRGSGDLLIKVPAARVDQLIAAGDGGEVAPAGRRFREWAAIPAEAVDEWPAYLAEAYAFAAASRS